MFGNRILSGCDDVRLAQSPGVYIGRSDQVVHVSHQLTWNS